jgi:hypothetical protein
VIFLDYSIRDSVVINRLLYRNPEVKPCVLLISNSYKTETSRFSKPHHCNRSCTERHKVINWRVSTREFWRRVKSSVNLWVNLVDGNQCFEVKAGKVNTKYKFRSLFYKHM